MPSLDQLNRASQAWLKAATDLAIHVTAPFFIEAEGTSIQCVAFLPNFGGPKGMIVSLLDRESPTDNRIIRYSKEHGLFYSFTGVNYAEYSKERFVEALEDWGYYGPRADRPAWFAGYDHSGN